MVCNNRSRCFLSSSSFCTQVMLLMMTVASPSFFLSFLRSNACYKHSSVKIYFFMRVYKVLWSTSLMVYCIWKRDQKKKRTEKGFLYEFNRQRAKCPAALSFSSKPG